MLSQYIQCLQRLSLYIAHRQILSHYSVPDLLFQLSLPRRFNVKGSHVHTHSGNNRMKKNYSLISNMHDVLQKTNEETEAVFQSAPYQAFLPRIFLLGSPIDLFVVNQLIQKNLILCLLSQGSLYCHCNLEGQLFIQCEIRYSVNEALSHI